jgi:ElaA protein
MSSHTIMAIAPLTLEWQSKAFDRLTVNELYDVMRLRMAVFVVEQQCCYQDADSLDPPPGLRYAEPSIGRVVVDSHFRGSGIGRSLMTRGIEITSATYPTLGIRLSAQKYLDRFYRSFGFSTEGDDYLEDGIPHVEMYRP